MVRIFIKDNTTGSVREYGTNRHDSLILQDNGSIHYYNLQNGCGTIFPEEGYSFVLGDGTDPREDEDIAKYGAFPFLDIGGENDAVAGTAGDTVSRQAVLEAVHSYFLGLIKSSPSETDEDGDEIYADMPKVNEWLTHNKKLTSIIKSIRSESKTEPLEH